MFRFLRKKKNEETQPLIEPLPALQLPAPASTTPVAPSPVSTEESADGATRPKRRRGSRGGRGRGRKPAEAAGAAAVVEEAPSPSAKPERRPSGAERKPSTRQRSGGRRRVEPRRAALPDAKRELLVSVDVSEQRVAVLEDDRVAEVYLERPERRSIAGDIYLGTVDNVLPGMEAAFVEIGLEKNGFLYVDEIVVPELEGKRHGKKIQDLLSRGQTILVQAVKDPMKTKGARLTTEISLPGRFVVFVPNGEGLGVSRRLPDEERVRLREILKSLDIPQGGLIVRTAAEGASAEDIERDIVFLQRLWKSISARAETAAAPALVYQEAELPLRVVRDLFTGDFERAVIDHDRTFRRVVGYLKKTSPHMVERVIRSRDKTPLFESYGVDAELRSTLSRRVDLPSGGYLVFDYAEAFTVIDVNTGRFVGSRSKNSGARLEDTITKNNLEAVKEVVHQLRLRDIGGIIVIDFIDMANPKNRALVEEGFKQELERDRTKTYVVEISPLGLVEMTRQNVTDGPREILTRKCPTCAGDGVVLSEASAAVDTERRLRALVPGSRTQAFRVELHPRVASILIGPGASRLLEIEAQTKRRFFVEPIEGVPLDHFRVARSGKVEELQPSGPLEDGKELEVKLGEVGLHDPAAGVGKVEGMEVCVGEAAALVGKKVRVRIERVLDSTAYARWLDAPAPAEAPITAELEAEKPTRQPRARKLDAALEAPAEEAALIPEDEAEVVEGDEIVEETVAGGGDAEPPKKRTRRGTRGGRGRKRKTPGEGEAGADTEDAGEDEAATAVLIDADDVASESDAASESEPQAAPRIHVPTDALGREDEDDDESADGNATAQRKRTRRGTRGGRNRRRTPVAAAPDGGSEEEAVDADADADAEVAVVPATVQPPLAEEPLAASSNGDGDAEWAYVPMAQWDDEVTPSRAAAKDDGSS